MASSLVRYLAASGIASPSAEAVAEEWTEIYLTPRPAAHLAFLAGSWTGEQPFLEAVVKFGSRPEPIPYGAQGNATTWIEFRGCLFKEPTLQFRQKLAEFFRLRTEVFFRPHQGLPPHREVPPEEAPKEPQKGGSSGGGVGTRVVES